jgi:hypothetical protein
MESPPKTDIPALTSIAGALLGLAVILLLRRYAGITHDSILYLGQGLLHRWPDIFGKDLFFAHGNQGQYSMLPQMLGLVLHWLQPPAVFLWFTLAWLLLFASASLYSLSGLLPPGQRYLAWLGVLCLPTMYGMTLMFSYNEAFLTPRPIAETFGLLAIGLLARKRRLHAVACIMLAGLFHPLQAIAVVLIVWPWLVLQDRRWLHAAWLSLPIILMALIGLEPFAGLLQQTDQAWLATLRQYTPQLFLSQWHATDFNVLGFDLLALAYAWRILRGPFGTWCLAALAGLVLGFGASLLLVDVLHLELPTALQLWRVHWLAHWFAMAALALAFSRHIGAGDTARALLLALICLLAWYLPGYAWIPLGVVYAAWPRIFAHSNARMASLLGGLFGLGVLGVFAYYIASELLPFRMAHYRLDLYAFDRRLLVFPLIAFGLPLLGVHAWNHASRKGRWLLVACVLCPLVALGAARWDARSPVIRAFERNAQHTDIFGIHLPADAQVYWNPYPLLGSWLVLQRASYFSVEQLAGQVFNRKTAADGLERFKRMEPLIADDLACQDHSVAYEERQHCRVSDGAIRTACAAGPGLRPDYLVLPYRQHQPAVGFWTILDPVEREPAMTLWLYRCTDVDTRP